MLSHEALREQAERLKSVMVPSETLLELLDAAERAQVKPKAPRAPRQANNDDEKCARWLFGVLLNTAPKARQPSIAAWAKDIRLMRERDGRTHREICELFQWAHSDSFWHKNVLCPKTLRDKWDRLTLQRGSVIAAPVRETVESRNARLRAEFLGVGGAPAAAYLQLEA